MVKANSQCGYVLLEALISLLIFALGVLGMIGFQANAAKLATESQLRTDAAILVDELIAEMRVSAPATFKTDFALNGKKTVAWKDGRLTAAGVGLPDGKITTLTIADGATPTSFVVDITIGWKAPGTITEEMSYATRALIF